MGLDKDIITLIKAEGYKINETIREALDELISIVTDENESMQSDPAAQEKPAADDT